MSINIKETLSNAWNSAAQSNYGVQATQYLAPYSECAGKKCTAFAQSSFGIQAANLFGKTLAAGSVVMHTAAATIADKIVRVRPYFADVTAHKQLAKEALTKTDAKGFAALAVVSLTATYIAYRALKWTFSTPPAANQK